jgi:hypothetical protein
LSGTPGSVTLGILALLEAKPEEAWQAHLSGAIPTALGQVAEDLLAAAPDIKTVDLLAAK